MNTPEPTVLLTGATGFVGGHVYRALESTRYRVRCATRRPAEAANRNPERDWTYLDVNDVDSIRPALEGCDAVIYLVHGMAGGEGYEQREADAARAVAEAARELELRRLVYLGGVAPQGAPSSHLRSRLQTGEILRDLFPGTIELRAGMIIGVGSESWQICRDLAARLPLMVLPKWLRSRSCPVYIDDVVAALVHALDHPATVSKVYDLPGPDTLSSSEVLFRIAALRGMKIRAITVPVVSPRLSSYWLGLVTGANVTVARELVEGLVTDLLPTQPSYWGAMGEFQPRGFDDAALRALAEEEPASWRTRTLERLMLRLAANRER